MIAVATRLKLVPRLMAMCDTLMDVIGIALRPTDHPVPRAALRKLLAAALQNQWVETVKVEILTDGLLTFTLSMGIDWRTHRLRLMQDGREVEMHEDEVLEKAFYEIAQYIAVLVEEGSSGRILFRLTDEVRRDPERLAAAVERLGLAGARKFPTRGQPEMIGEGRTGDVLAELRMELVAYSPDITDGDRNGRDEVRIASIANRD